MTQITATDNPWQFRETCPGCGDYGTIAWATANPPPTYDAPAPTLFDAQEQS